MATSKVEVYLAVDRPSPNPAYNRANIALPSAYRILYWNGSDFVPVDKPEGLGKELDSFNITTLDEVRTNRMRIEVKPDGLHPASILEWRVASSGPIPIIPPVVNAGLDRAIVLGGKTYLAGSAVWLEPKPQDVVRWTKESGPGTVSFANAATHL